MAETKPRIDPEVFDDLLRGVDNERDLTGVLRQLSKQLIERVLEAELTEHLGHEPGEVVINSEGNVRNGSSKKTLKGELGQVDLDIPRDRQGNFEPQLVKKHQRRLAGLDERILSLYARGLSTRDIQAELKEFYDVEVIATLISEVTDAVLSEVKGWQQRPLDTLYPVVYLDCVFVKLRVEGVVRTQAVYLAIAINLQGLKEVLGMWVGKEQKEGAKFWLSVLNELKQRGLDDVFIFCVDGLKGFPEAIEQVYPHSQVQLCIVHLIRNSLTFVPWGKRKAVAHDLKTIYTAVSEEKAEEALAVFEQTYKDSYPTIAQLWRRNWEHIIPIFDYPADIRRAIYTTNVIESLNYSLKKPLKTRGAFPTEDALRKVLYLAIMQASKKWTMPIRDWKKALNWFAQLFGARLLDKLGTQNS